MLTHREPGVPGDAVQMPPHPPMFGPGQANPRAMDLVSPARKARRRSAALTSVLDAKSNTNDCSPSQLRSALSSRPGV